MGRMTGIRGQAGDRTRRNAGLGQTVMGGLLAGVVITGAVAASPPMAWAQQTRTQADAAAGAIAFSIPAQPLQSAVAAFIRRSGWEVGYSSALIAGKRSVAVNGTMRPGDALRVLLSGTGIEARMTAETKAALVEVAAGGVDAGGATVLDMVRVQGDNVGGMLGPDSTIVATGSTAGSKTDTPLRDVPASVSVVTQKELQQRGVTKLDEALAYTAGVSTDIYGSDDRYDFFLMRGFYQGATGNYRDGLPMRNSSFTGSRMEPYGMQRIEALKGSTSTLFGLNSPGGLVNAITKRPQDYKFGEVYTTFGEDHAETGTDFGGPIDDEGLWSYRLTGKWQNGSNGIDFSQDDRLYIAPALTFSPSDATSFTLLSDYNRRRGNTAHGIPYQSGIDSETYLGEPDFDNMDTTERNIGYAFEHDFGGGLSFRQNARHTDLDLTYESVYGGSTDPSVRRQAIAIHGHSERFALDNQLQYDASFGRFDSRTLLGFDYTNDKVRESRADGSADGISVTNPVYCGRACVTLPTPGVSDNDMITKGLYLQEELTFDDRIILTLGGRYDHVETVNDYGSYGYRTTEEAFTTRAGLTYKATDEVSVYASYSESFQPVSPLYAAFLGNSRAQEGMQYEIGAKYQPTGIDALFTLALFDLTQTNVAQWNGTLPTQVGKVNVQGIELEGKMALTNQVNLTLAYSYWKPEIEDDDLTANIGNRPQLVPNHLASAWLDYTIPGNGTLGDLTLGLGARFVGKTYGDNANTIELPSRTLVDAALHYKVTDATTLSVTATNIFDREHITHVDTWNNTAYYGDRRTIKASLRYTW